MRASSYYYRFFQAWNTAAKREAWTRRLRLRNSGQAESVPVGRVGIRVSSFKCTALVVSESQLAAYLNEKYLLFQTENQQVNTKSMYI